MTDDAPNTHAGSAPEDAPPHEVVLDLPADTRYVSTLRLVASSLGAQSELTIDTIEDLRLAVDEAAALLAPHAAPGSSLRTTFHIRSHRLEATLAVTPVPGDDAEQTIDRTGFAWTLLTALTEGIEVTTSAGSLGLQLSVRRADGA